MRILKHLIIQDLLLTVLVLCLGLQSYGQYQQDDRVLLTIEDEKVTVAEFMNVYNKNNVNNETVDQQALEEYLALYVNFKLKVREAKELGLDTLESFIKELDGYRKQLAEPYFIDEEVNEALMRTAYERSLYDIRASHILVKVDEYAAPEDTLKAYKKIMKIRERVTGGEDFANVAMSESDDPTAADRPADGGRRARKGNRGDLGYFSVFDMIYPFEEASYSTEVGEFSMPVRTAYGYHIIYVRDKQEALGRAKVAHIYLSFPNNPTREDSLKNEGKINEVYKKLQEGEPFEELVKQYSDDKGTVDKGGVLPWFGSNRMVPDFIDAVKQLNEPGDYSAPVLTDFGWHIIMLKERKKPGTYEEEKENIKRRMVKDLRYQKGKQSVINKIKSEYGFKENTVARDEVFATLDSTFVSGKWTVEKIKGMDKTVFELGNKRQTQQDLGNYIQKVQGLRGIKPVKDFLKERYNLWIDDYCIAYEDGRLEEKYPEFRMLMEEYRDGILLFNLTDEKVWTRAIKDTTGLEAFHAEHKMDYMWGERLDADICIVNENININDVRKSMKKGTDNEKVLDSFNQDSIPDVFIEERIYSRGDSDLIDDILWTEGLSEVYLVSDNPDFKFHKDISDQARFFIRVNKVMPPEPKSLEEARGLITSDYQNYLEQNWVSELKEKYTVVINQEVLSTIK